MTYTATGDYGRRTPQLSISEAKIKRVALIILALSPFVQLGFSYYFSVQVLIFLLLLLVLSEARGPSTIHADGAIIGTALVVFLAPSLTQMESSFFQASILKAAREYICFVVLYVTLKRAKHFDISGAHQIKTVVILLVLSLFSFVVLQLLSFRESRLFHIPIEFYIANSETIPTEFSLMVGDRVRPSAFFGEPSYLSFFVFSLLFIVSKVFSGSKLKTFLLLTLSIIPLLSVSLSGVLAVGLFHIYRLNSESKASPLTKIVLVLLFCSVMFTLFKSGVVQESERLFNILDKDAETSGYSRMVLPLKIIYHVITERIVGIPAFEIGKFAYSHHLVSDMNFVGVDNGLLNNFIFYGFFGALLLFFLYRASVGGGQFFYLLISAMFSGSFYTYDKVGVMGVVIIICSLSRPINGKRRTKGLAGQPQ
jgi:hypothetical protein